MRRMRLHPRFPAGVDRRHARGGSQARDHGVAGRALKMNGRLGIVNFKKDGGGPGPPLEERVDPDRIIRDAKAAGLRLLSRHNFLRYQYLLVFVRNDSPSR